MNYFPPLPEGAAWSLELVLRGIKSEPGYLDDEDCPYSEEDRKALERIAGQRRVEIEEDAEIDPNEDKWARLERETKELFDGLMSEQDNFAVKDNAEKMAFFRTATSLLDKLVGIQERAANLRQIHQFHDAVLRIMEDTLDAGQRTNVMEELRRAINE